MKPPISYYGGKQRIASKIIPFIPKHVVYCEPFCGGATILFMKPYPEKGKYIEVMNDQDRDLVNFFRQLRDNGEELVSKLWLTPYSEHEYQTSKRKYLHDCEPVERARRYFTNLMQSFANKVNGGWRCSVLKDEVGVWKNKLHALDSYIDRMSKVAIACTDALKLIKQYDSPHTFFYCDPPYPGTHQGHYGGYTMEDFQSLVNTLNECEGSFIVSCYEQDEMIIPEDWVKHQFAATMSANRDKTANKKRTETIFVRGKKGEYRPDIKKLLESGRYDCFTG